MARLAAVDRYENVLIMADSTPRPAARKGGVTHFPGVERFNGIGQLPPEALRVLWNDFQDVNEAQLSLGGQAWHALTSPTPEALVNLVQTQAPALPTMGRALARHLRQWPSAENGLNLTEQLTLKILAEKGTMNAPRLFGWLLRAPRIGGRKDSTPAEPQRGVARLS